MPSRALAVFLVAAFSLVVLMNLSRISNIVSSKHGGYTSWTIWSECSAFCGGGRTVRTRNCSNPKPSGWGRKCNSIGPSYEIKLCGIVECPIDGGPGAWGAWGACDHTCGSGLMPRTRPCDSPKPQFGGKDCRPELLTESTACLNLKPCPIDGKWGDYGPFSACSVTCGDGKQKKTRACNNPAPQHGGKPCPNEPSEIVQDCKVKDCPTNSTTTSADANKQQGKAEEKKT